MTANTISKTAIGFTLVEMLVVVGILALLMGISFAIPLHEEREGQVRAAAEELASVLRETRTRAMRTNRTYAVVFNIENAPGSSGKTLNNRSGGHWYRVLGPSDARLANPLYKYNPIENIWCMPPLYENVSPVTGVKTTTPVIMRYYLGMVNRSWIDEPHRLAKGKVRFLALTDQDNGDNNLPGIGGYYSATYPRPWFGWWDATTQELRTWGGYDPTLKKSSKKVYRWDYMQHLQCGLRVNGRLVSHSGFFYEGYEGEITGCVNPDDRMALDDKDGSGVLDAADYTTAPKFYVMQKKGEPRPLINGAWVDFAIIFRPNGSVDTSWFRMRQGYTGYWPWPPAPSYFNGGTDPQALSYPMTASVSTNDCARFLSTGVPDRCSGLSGQTNYADETAPFPGRSRMQREATDYVNHTGYYWISLAPDTQNDNAKYPSAQAALRDMLPLYRVGVTPLGLVTVIRVRTTNPINPKPGEPKHRVFDTAIVGADWENRNKIWGKSGTVFNPSAACTGPNYMNHTLHEMDGSPRGEPAYDMVLPEMLSERKWWLEP